MLRQTTVWLHTEHMRRLDVLAKNRGLKASQLVRLAIREYLERETRREKGK